MRKLRPRRYAPSSGEVPPLDALLLNAGTQLRTGASRTPDGFETTFAVSRFAWRTLLPLATLTPFATTARRAGELLAAASVGSRPGESGDYLDLGRAVRSSAESYDIEREEQLWTEANRLCADALGRA